MNPIKYEKHLLPLSSFFIAIDFNCHLLHIVWVVLGDKKTTSWGHFIVDGLNLIKFVIL